MVDILLVDDRPENLQALQAVLDDPSYRLTCATSANEAFRCLLRADFCLILLDARMPGMDGIEAARIIKQREKTAHVPIIFLTAAGMDVDTLHEAYGAGAVDYLVKPIDPDIVRAKVSVFVELHRKARQLKEQSLQLAGLQEQLLDDVQKTSERRYRNLADALPQIVWRALPDGSIEYCNRRFSEYAACDKDAFWDCVHPSERTAMTARWEEALRTGDPLTAETRLLRKDGAFRWHLRRAVAERGKNGEIIAWLGTDTDIDDRKRADDERMELLVRERAARFEAEAAQKRAAQLYVEARDALALRDDFLTIAAHELRTPLTTLKLQIQGLSRAMPVPDERKRMVHRQIDRLCRLVEDLLDVSRAQGGQLLLRTERSDLSMLVREAVERTAEEARTSGCTLTLSAPPAPRSRFSQPTGGASISATTRARIAGSFNRATQASMPPACTHRGIEASSPVAPAV